MEYKNNQVHCHTVPASQKKIQEFTIGIPQIVPVIFIPGVMGSNLKQKTDSVNPNPVWRLDRTDTIIGWGMPGYGSAKARKSELDPAKTVVDDRGYVVDAAAKEIELIEQEYLRTINDLKDTDTNIVDVSQTALQLRNSKIDDAIADNLENAILNTRQSRGWGSVSYISYGKFLESLQNKLFNPDNRIILSDALTYLTRPTTFSLDKGSCSLLTLDKNQIKHCDSFFFPIYAMGYNWLQSNEESAQQLKLLVEKTLPSYYKGRYQSFDKVILVTHSMGGLVARYYTEVLGGSEKVYGVINGVQPATGAVAAYTRMKRGTEANNSIWLVNKVTKEILGEDAKEMTAVCAQSPGPLQLLPTPEYGMGWLKISNPDGKIDTYPKSDPYTEIYLAKDKWWCACEPHLINPFNIKHNKVQMEQDWKNYKNIIMNKVKIFNEDIANKYHPNTYVFFGLDTHKKVADAYLTYEEAHWKGEFFVDNKTKMKQPSNDHIGANNRLDLSEKKEVRTISPRRHEWQDIRQYSSNASYYQITRGYINETYTLQPANGNGDGTVPQTSGEIPMQYLKARTRLPLEHEPAYQSDISQEFTLRAIIDIMQQVKVKLNE